MYQVDLYLELEDKLNRLKLLNILTLIGVFISFPTAFALFFAGVGAKYSFAEVPLQSAEFFLFAGSILLALFFICFWLNIRINRLISKTLFKQLQLSMLMTLELHQKALELILDANPKKKKHQKNNFTYT